MERVFLRMFLTGLTLVALTGSPLLRVTAAQGGASPARLVFQQSLPAMNGKHLKVSIREVRYAPGESSPPHTHPCPVVAYVTQGALQIQIQGTPERIYKAGETFYEAPNSIHRLSKNASQTAPAALLAYFICDHETGLTRPVK